MNAGRVSGNSIYAATERVAEIRYVSAQALRYKMGFELRDSSKSFVFSLGGKPVIVSNASGWPASLIDEDQVWVVSSSSADVVAEIAAAFPGRVCRIETRR